MMMMHARIIPLLLTIVVLATTTAQISSFLIPTTTSATPQKRVVGSFLPSSSSLAPCTIPVSSSASRNMSFIRAAAATSDDNNPSSSWGKVDGEDSNEMIGKRLILTGDVNGGYLRTCIINEASRFRNLVGTMSPPDDSDTAEVYVEGSRKMVESFVRWCQRGTKKVGLSQKLEVTNVWDEDPTGLYDGFYAKTGR